MCTHEQYIHSVAALVIKRVPKEKDAKYLKAIKLVYGSGGRGLRGTTFYEAWKNGVGSRRGSALVEICAFGESDLIQLAGTTIHELGHVLAGIGVGHGKGWKDSCQVLGLRITAAGGQAYGKDDFDEDLWTSIQKLKKPSDGKPGTPTGFPAGSKPRKPKACSMGIGSRGGTSRGLGSSSRLLKVACGTCGYTVRVTRKWLDVGLPHCPEHGPMVEDEGTGGTES